MAAVRQGDEHLLLRLAIHRAIPANGARLAAFFAVNNVTPCCTAEAHLHELVLHRVLNAFDLDGRFVSGATETFFHHRLREALGVGLHRFVGRCILIQFCVGLQGRLNGKINSRFIKVDDVPVSFSNLELLTFEGV